MKEIVTIILLSLLIMSLIIMITIQYNPFSKIFLFFKRKNIIVLNKYKSENIQLQFKDNTGQPLQIHNKLPEFLVKKHSVIYNHSYTNFENIFIFKSSNEKWGALKYDKDSRKHSIIADNVYDSTAFNHMYKIIEAVIYKNGKYSNDNTYAIFNTEGEILKKIDNINYINFDNFGNIIFSKDQLYGLFDGNFEIIIPAKYKAFFSLQKNLFLVKKSSESEQLLINDKDEVIYNLGLLEIVYKSICNDKIIIKESQNYYLLNIKTGSRTTLDYDIIYPISKMYNISFHPTTKFITVINYINDEDSFYDKYGIFPDRFISDSGKYGIIDAEGKICVSNIYDKIQQIHDDYFKVAIGKFNFKINPDTDEIIASGGKWGIINSRSEIIVPVTFTNIYYDRHRNSFLAYEGGVMIGYEDSHDNTYIWSVNGGKEIEFRI